MSTTSTGNKLVQKQRDMTEQHYANIELERTEYTEAAAFLALASAQQQETTTTGSNNNNITATEAATATTTTTMNSKKMTKSMQDSLFKLQQECLTCPLCQHVLVQPVTISSCAHTFCCDCIDEYCENNWYCPIENCGMPLSMKSSTTTQNQSTKFRTVNSATQTVVTSWSKICHTLQQSKDDWWKTYGGDKENDDNDSVLMNSDVDDEEGEAHDQNDEDDDDTMMMYATAPEENLFA